MKVSALILLTAVASLSTFAQDKAAPIASPPTPSLAVTNKVDTNLLANPRPPQPEKPPLVTFSGLGPDIAKSTNRWKMFSLRRPANPKEDTANLITDTKSEISRPVKLFSIDF